MASCRTAYYFLSVLHRMFSAEKPEVLNAPSTVRTNENSFVMLVCVGTGLPKPAVYWLYNGTKLTTLQTTADYVDTSVQTRGSFAVQSTVTIPSVQNSIHQGQYECVVENIHRPSARVSAFILVYGKCQ